MEGIKDEKYTTTKVSLHSLDYGKKEENYNDEINSRPTTLVTYRVDDVPPPLVSIVLALQHILMMIGATVAIPLLLADALCIGDDNVTKCYLIGTILFVSGLATFLQATFGVRLPIIQGGSFSFVTPALVILSLPKWKCPENNINDNIVLNTSFLNDTTFNNLFLNDINSYTSFLNGFTTLSNDQIEINYTALSMYQNDLNSTTLPNDQNDKPIWMTRMREIQGAIMVASCFQVLFGFTGLVGLLLRFIGPLTVAPTLSLIGLSLFPVTGSMAGSHWGISSLTFTLIAVFSQYMGNVKVPCINYSKRKGLHKTSYTLFRIFPVVMAIVIAWLVCFILSEINALPSDPDAYGYSARTDINLDVLWDSPWFRFPYPGQWGTPTVSAASVIGMLAGVIASMVESVGDYYACARLAGAPPPPPHAINRGIGMEGIACLLAGAWGTGNGTTSYSENVGAIGITKVGSRFVIQTAAFILIFLGVFVKFGALFVTMPEPIIGGMFTVMFGMVTAVGITNLQFVDLNSTRNLFIVGCSLFMGLTIPSWMQTNPNSIETGITEIDQIIIVLLSTNMFVGGFFGILLDNTIPGTVEERGMIKWKEIEVTDSNYTSGLECYDIPLIMPCVVKFRKMTGYLPFCPTSSPSESVNEPEPAFV